MSIAQFKRRLSVAKQITERKPSNMNENMQPQKKYHKEADGTDKDNHCRLVDKLTLNFLAFIDITDGIPSQYQMISILSFRGASKRALVIKKNTRRNSKPRD